MTDVEIRDKEDELAILHKFILTPAYKDFLEDIRIQIDGAMNTVFEMPTSIETQIAREQAFGAHAVLKDLPDWFADRISLLQEDLTTELNKHKLD